MPHPSTPSVLDCGQRMAMRSRRAVWQAFIGSGLLLLAVASCAGSSNVEADLDHAALLGAVHSICFPRYQVIIDCAAK